MANNPSPNKQLNRPDKGDLDWNTPLNANFTSLDNILGSTVSPVNVSNVYTLSSTDIDNMRILVSGTITADATVTLPPTYGGYWIVTNTTTGSFNVRVKVTTGANLVTVPQGYSIIVFSNGSEAYDALNSKLSVTGGTISGNLTVNNVFTVGSGAQLQFDSTQSTPVLNISGNIVATGNVTAFGTIPSDHRLKNNIETIQNALDIVHKLRGVTFNMKMNGKSSLGLIAQEVQEVLPSLVFEGPDEMLSVAYANIVGVLVNAVNELSERVKKLEEN
jgi:Chaperone of endosialidase